MSSKDKVIKKILKIFDDSCQFIWSYSKLREHLTNKDIENLRQIGILTLRETWTDGKIPWEGNEYVVDTTEIDKGYLILRYSNGEEYKKIPVEYAYEYKINYEQLVRVLSERIFCNIGPYSIEKCQITPKTSAFILTKINIKDCYEVVVLFQHVTDLKITGDMLITISRLVAQRCPVLIVVTRRTLKDLLNVLGYVAVGYFVKLTTYGRLFEKKEIKDIISWIDYAEKIIKLEEEILQWGKKSENEKSKEFDRFKELVFKVDTNPKYLLTIMNLFKSLRIANPQDKEIDDLFEYLVNLSFTLLYEGYPFKYGHHDRGESVPDGIFFIRDDNGIIRLVGIVDAKSSVRGLKLNQSDVEKYSNYVWHALRTEGIGGSIICLYFVCFETYESIMRKLEYTKESSREEKGFRDFYSKICQRLPNNAYIVIVPLESLITLIENYLSVVLKSGISLSIRGCNVFREVIMPYIYDDSGYWRKSEYVGLGIMKELRDRLFYLDYEKLREYLSNKIKEGLSNRGVASQL